MMVNIVSCNLLSGVWQVFKEFSRDGGFQGESQGNPSLRLSPGTVICDITLGMEPHVDVAPGPSGIHEAVTTTWIFLNWHIFFCFNCPFIFVIFLFTVPILWDCWKVVNVAFTISGSIRVFIVSNALRTSNRNVLIGRCFWEGSCTVLFAVRCKNIQHYFPCLCVGQSNFKRAKVTFNRIVWHYLHDVIFPNSYFWDYVSFRSWILSSTKDLICDTLTMCLIWRWMKAPMKSQHPVKHLYSLYTP